MLPPPPPLSGLLSALYVPVPPRRRLDDEGAPGDGDGDGAADADAASRVAGDTAPPSSDDALVGSRLAPLSGASLACLLAMYVCRGAVAEGAPGMCNPDELVCNASGALVGGQQGSGSAVPSPTSAAAAAAEAASHRPTVAVPATPNPAVGADPSAAVFQPVLTTSSTMRYHYCFVRGAGAGACCAVPCRAPVTLQRPQVATLVLCFAVAMASVVCVLRRACACEPTP